MHIIQARLSTKENEGRPVSAHEFPLPGVSEKGFYRATISYDAFRRFENTKLFNSLKQKNGFPAFHFSLKPKTEWEDDEKVLSKVLASHGIDNKHDQLDVIQYASIWDFYQAIGFDWKNRRYRKDVVNEYCLTPDYR